MAASISEEFKIHQIVEICKNMIKICCVKFRHKIERDAHVIAPQAIKLLRRRHLHFLYKVCILAGHPRVVLPISPEDKLFDLFLKLLLRERLSWLFNNFWLMD